MKGKRFNKMATIDLSKYGITGTTEVVYNPSYEMLFCLLYTSYSINPYFLYSLTAVSFSPTTSSSSCRNPAFFAQSMQALSLIHISNTSSTFNFHSYILLSATYPWAKLIYSAKNPPPGNNDTAPFAVAIKAVSYTHLDVYKRQVRLRNWSWFQWQWFNQLSRR